jgi:thiaminase
LSSAVATWQPVVDDWFEAVDRSKRWLTESLRHGESLEVGSGHGPISHFAGLWARGGLDTVHRVTEDWWLEIAEVRDAVDACDFVQGLADGTVSSDDFTWYLAQDALYLDAYAAVLNRLAELASDPEERAFWAKGAEECIEEEAAMHRDWLAGADRATPSPTTEAYLQHLSASVERGYDVGVAAVLPCYWMYADIGSRLSRDVPDAHPYGDWLRTYGDPVFAEAAEQARDVTDRVARASDGKTRAEMARAFVRSAELELEFFRAPTES